MGRVGGNIDGASVCGALIAGAASRRFSHADFLQVQCAALPAAQARGTLAKAHTSWSYNCFNYRRKYCSMHRFIYRFNDMLWMTAPPTYAMH